MNKKIILSIAIMLAFNACINAQPENYYVSNSHPDASDESSDPTNKNTPWKTIKKVNEWGNFKEGDSILFKCGDIWRGEELELGNWGRVLVATNSGKPGQHITYGSYGEGEKPKIYGSVASKGSESP